MRYYLPPRQGPTYVLDKSALYCLAGGYRLEA